MSRASVDSQLERLLVLVPWVMAQEEGPLVEDVCARFDMTEAQLAANLELLFLCGVYPFTPDSLIEADIVDGRVWIRSADAFQRPPFFRPQEAIALVAAASAALNLPGNEDNQPLRSALSKLTDILGVGAEGSVQVELSQVVPQVIRVLEEAVQKRTAVELDYYSSGRDTWTHRTIEPYRVFNTEGQWYAQAGLPGSGEIRNFRLDRMRQPEVTTTTFTMPSDLPPATSYHPRPDDPTLTLDLAPEGRWVAEQYPVLDTTQLADGWTRVQLKISEPAWAQRLLLRLGSKAKVVQGDVDLTQAVERIARRYQEPAGTQDEKGRTDKVTTG